MNTIKLIFAVSLLAGTSHADPFLDHQNLISVFHGTKAMPAVSAVKHSPGKHTMELAVQGEGHSNAWQNGSGYIRREYANGYWDEDRRGAAVGWRIFYGKGNIIDRLIRNPLTALFGFIGALVVFIPAVIAGITTEALNSSSWVNNINYAVFGNQTVIKRDGGKL